jgi:hypothetical protein
MVTWDLLNQFSGIDISLLLNGSRIDGLENVITMEMNHHQAFGSFKLWFTPHKVDLSNVSN